MLCAESCPVSRQCKRPPDILRAWWNHREGKAGARPARIERAEVGVVDVFCRAPLARPCGARVSGRRLADRREHAVCGDERAGILEPQRFVRRGLGHDPRCPRIRVSAPGPQREPISGQFDFRRDSGRTIALPAVHGCVFWEGPYRWELHPFTAWKRSSSPPPPPPSNSPPSVDFSWTPISGNNSTVFSFTAQVSDDHDSASSIQVRWDWTGDGTWDTAWSTTKIASHRYSTAGNKTVVVEAIDSGGLTARQSHLVQVTAQPPPPPPPPPNAPPTADFTLTPNSGNTSTVFSFTETAADDHDSSSSIQVRWDWNGDGTWDTAWSTTKTATHTLSAARSYTVIVQAVDSGGLTAIQSHSISVTAPPPPPPPPPDFGLGASPSSLTILCGSSGSSTITLTSLNRPP